MESKPRLCIIGGGAAGFFAAATAARLACGNAEIHLLEKGRHFLTKVRISGGGRCNTTHACFDPVALARNYPRGERELRGTFHRFGPAQTIEWFAGRSVELKTEADGRMFPATDSSATIIDCLHAEALKHGVILRPGTNVHALRPHDRKWIVETQTGSEEIFDRVLLATGGCKDDALLAKLNHVPEPPVPSLFSFHLPDSCWMRALPGLTIENVRLQLEGTRLSSTGPLLITHLGISGPAVLKLSAWGARALSEMSYSAVIKVRWLPDFNESTFQDWISTQRREAPARKPANTPPPGLPLRFWEALLAQSGEPDAPDADTRWTTLPRASAQWISRQILESRFEICGKSPNKEEFVTCGGIRRSEVNFHTMESKLHPGLFFAGEALDIDGITGGFNFQAAWTTAWIAGHSLAADIARSASSIS